MKISFDFSAEDMDGHRVKVNNNALNNNKNNNSIDGGDIIEIEEVKDTTGRKSDEARANGNELFKKKLYKEAIEAYKEVIRHDNTRAAFTNLAAAWLQLSKQIQNEVKKLKNLRGNDGIDEKNANMFKHAEKCIEACKDAIKRDPTYVKAFHRFGQALDILGKKDDALNKLKEAKKVLQAEIRSKPPKEVLKKLKKLKKSIGNLEADIKERQEAEDRASNGWGINNINVSNNGNKKKGKTDKKKKKKKKLIEELDNDDVKVPIVLLLIRKLIELLLNY